MRLVARWAPACSVVAASVALVLGGAGGWWLTLTGSEPEPPEASAEPAVPTDEVATDTPEEIRARWEETKGELTAGWKRRHREAIKSKRRRGGGGGDAD